MRSENDDNDGHVCVSCGTVIPRHSLKRMQNHETRQWDCFCHCCPFVALAVLYEKEEEYGDLERKDDLLALAYKQMKYTCDSHLILSPARWASGPCLVTGADQQIHTLYNFVCYAKEPNFLLLRSRTDRLFVCYMDYRHRETFKRFFMSYQ